MTTFNKLLAIKSGGGNPGAPGSSDTLNVALAEFGLTASGNSLLALNAEELDFGNVTANPDFNFLGAGDFTVAGDSHFSATGGNTGDPDFLVDGYAKFAGAIEVTGSSFFTGDATFNSNVTVLGTLVTKQTESVLISDNYIDMNSGYATVSPQDTGFTFNYSPIANATITAMTTGQNTITLAANSGIALVPGDIVLVTGLDAADVQNEGLYEVLSFASDVITVNTASGLTFLKHAVAKTVAVAPQGAALAHVNLGVLRVSTAGDLQYGENSDANITFGDVPYNGYVGSQTWTGYLELNSEANNPGYLRVNDNNGDHTFIAAQDGISAALSILIENGAQDSNGLLFQAAAGDVNVAATNSAIYTKTVSGIIELFYNSEINGVETPIQITSNGELDVTIPTVTLQAAYDGGTSITTTINGGAVTINDGTAGDAPALDVTGSMSLGGDLDIEDAQDVSVFTVAASTGNTSVGGTLTVAGDISLTNAQATEVFSVDAATGALNVPVGAVTFGSTLAVTGAVTLSSTLGVTGASTLGALDAGSTTLDDLTVSGASSFSTIGATGAVTLNDTLNVDGAVTFTSTLGVSGLSTLDSLSVTNNASVGGTFGATGAATLSDTLAVTGAATLSSTLAVTGNITASADVIVTGILDLNGSVDADVSAFDLLSSGDVSIKADGILSLKGPAVAANLAETAGAAVILPGDLVSMAATGLAKAVASSQNVIALGVALAEIAANASSEGKVAEFGSAVINAAANLNIAKGDRLYLSAATAGAVTNVEPSAAGSSVFQVGVALEDANNAVSLKVALRPQFMYNVF